MKKEKGAETNAPAVDQKGRKPPRKWMMIEPIRLLGQAVFIFFLNFTVIGSIYFAPFTPVLRLDIPMDEVPFFYEHGQIRACPLATFQRGFTGTWEFMLLVFALSLFLIVVLLVGRALCGWACPFGLVQDLITRLRVALGLGAKEFSQNVHERLTLIRYALLGLFLLGSISIGISVVGNSAAGEVIRSYLPQGICQIAPYCGICPAPAMFYIISVFSGKVPLNIDDPVNLAMWVFMGIFFVGSYFQPRFFCRYICPTGALSSPFNRVSLLHLYKDIDKCTKCHVCYTNCPMRIREVLDEDENERLKDGDCIFCGECVQRCPDRALTFKFGPWTIYRGGTAWYDRLGFRKKK